MATGLENFAKADQTPVDPKIATSMSEFVPFIYFWFDVFNEKPVLMTAAVPWKGLKFGLSFPVDENKVRARIDSKKLIDHMREIVSVLVLHGKDILDSDNQIDPRKVNDQEAMRWKFDPLWDKRVKAVDKLTKIKYIKREEAVKLKLLDK